MNVEEKEAVDMFPDGYRLSLLFIAYVKNVLTTQKMTASYRLQFLEWIDRQVDRVITPEMLEIVSPMSAVEMAMVDEARSLDKKDGPEFTRCNASFKVLTGREVFEDFLALNPSLLAAIMLHQRQWKRLAA